MGLMKKAAAAFGFRDGGKPRKTQDIAAPAAEPLPSGALSAPQYELPPDLRFTLAPLESPATPDFPAADVALWAGRNSADGRLGVLLASSLRGMGMTLESPGGSSTGTPTGPTCTGGGHGEAPPSVGGHNPRLCTPTLRQSGSNIQHLHLLGPVCTATATPLARHVAARALRKAGDSAPITLPSITSLAGGARPRDTAPPMIQLPADSCGATSGSSGASSPPLSPPSSAGPGAGPGPSPRPPALSPVATGYGPSPRMRRSTTLETHVEYDTCQYVSVSAAAAAAHAAVGGGGGVATSPSAISAPLADQQQHQHHQQQPYATTHERFSRLHVAHDLSYGSPEQISGGGTAGGGVGDASKGGSTGAGGAAAPNSMPICPIQYEDSTPPLTPHAPSAAAAAVTGTAAPVNIRAVMAGGAAAASSMGVPHAPGPRHSSTSQLSVRTNGLVPYNNSQLQYAQQGRLPPRRVSDYSMHPVPPSDSTLPKLKSVASAMASAAAAAATAASLKAPEAPPPPSSPAAAAAAAAESPRPQSPLRPPTAVAVTALAESAAAAAGVAAEPRVLRPRAMRCINLEPLQQSAGGASDGAASSSGIASRSGSARASSALGGPISGAGAAAAAATPAAAIAVACVTLDPPSQPPPQLPSQPQPHPLAQLKPSPMSRSARRLASPASSSVAPLSPVPSVSGPGSPPAAAASPSPSPCITAEPYLPSRPASSTGSAPPPAPSPPPTSPPQHEHLQHLPLQQQVKEQHQPRSLLDEFVPRPSPAQGLLHFSSAAPVQMLRAPVSWGVCDYKVVRKLYAGYASSVYKATCLYSGSDVVLKAYNLAGLSTFLRNQVLRELDIHSRLRHPGVVHLMAAFREGDLLLLVLEYVRGGSLDRVRRKLGGRMTEFQAMHLVLLPLLGVLTYLHERGIVHRDIKPENLLFTESWQLKLCDYGVSICTREERAVTRTGSREYMAPEVNVCPLKRGPEDNKTNTSLAYTPAVDVWSLGSLMYELLVGFTPFPGGPPAGKEGVRGSAGAALAFPSSVSQGAREFVRSCMELEPADRPTVHQLAQHAWVQDALEYNASLQEGQ